MNYTLLFEKCDQHDINLHWLIMGKEPIAQLPADKSESSFRSSLDKRALEYVKMIQAIPWSVSVKRKILENYITVVYEDSKAEGPHIHRIGREIE